MLAESNCPKPCATGTCGQIPYSSVSSTTHSDQYTCTTSSQATGQATGVTCPNGKELFEVSCTLSDGFDIRINESCRKSYFPFIDFSNSFLWGNQTKSQMDTPSGSSGVDVDKLGVHRLLMKRKQRAALLTLSKNFSGTCSSVKLLSTGGVKDSDNVNSWNLKIPLSDCSITSKLAKLDLTGSAGNRYTEYELFWNSHLSANSQLFQIGQVKLVCRVDSFQVNT